RGRRLPAGTEVTGGDGGHRWGRRLPAGTEVTGGDGGHRQGRRSPAGTEVTGGDGGRRRGRRLPAGTEVAGGDGGCRRGRRSPAGTEVPGGVTARAMRQGLRDRRRSARSPHRCVHADDAASPQRATTGRARSPARHAPSRPRAAAAALVPPAEGSSRFGLSRRGTHGRRNNARPR